MLVPDRLYHLAREHGVVQGFRGGRPPGAQERRRGGGGGRLRGGARARARARRRRPGAVAVVAEQQPDLPLPSRLGPRSPRAAHPPPGLLELLLRQRQPRPRAEEREPLQRPQRERAPAAADLEHVVAGPQRRRVEQRVELGELRVLEGPPGRVQRGRVGHRLVEEEAVHVVPCVVVGLDVLARA